ncbi:DEAD/DEAH box helicase family protein [Patescibacteria group bacterium]|nr:DEAD/DEAH box helicase family protein [Patescibacteria group bacterium]
MNKKEMSETDIRTKYITPAILNAGWDLHKQIREEKPITDGRITIAGKTIKRGKRKIPDYILYYKPHIPLAIVEAKDNKHNLGNGIQQAEEYAGLLKIPFVFSSNGDAFIFLDTETGKEREITLDQFPSPKELWEKYKEYNKITEDIEEIVESEYHIEPEGKKPRYYQEIATNKVVEAVAKGKDRVLLVMATGTGKTYTAFQILWRLREGWKKKGKKNPRILYLADRNVLVDDPKRKDFKPLSKVAVKVSKRKIDPSYELYFALYQGVSGNEEQMKIYKNLSKDFFDIVVVDECHRGSAREDSAWKEILEYFSSSIQIGLTATPKETKNISNIEYFGDPVYTYSLKQGIEDGFLAPYRVIKVALDKDVHGYRPKKGEKDKYGNEIPDGVYTNREYDRTLVLEKRSEIVAKKITEFLKNTNRMDKTIVFCVDIEHADRMRRALKNENSDMYKKNNKYIRKITGDEKSAQSDLYSFMDPSSNYPVIVTTSKLLTTGVDVQTCKLIVLDSQINSMTEFKQIIGRGTRIEESYEKHFFTIMDFRNVSNKFADPDFDGDPVQVKTFSVDEEIKPEEIVEGSETLEEGERIIYHQPDATIKNEENKIKKFYVKETEVNVINDSYQYLDPSGRLITESIIDYTKKGINKKFRTMDEFLQKWNILDQKRALFDELEKEGLYLDNLREEIPNGKDYDPFDLILHIAYGKKPLTRSERAKKVKKDSYFDKYGKEAREVIESLLQKYEDEDLDNLEDPEVLRVDPLRNFGRPLEIMKLFGGKSGYQTMVKEIEERLYK